jgi:hypothetical protein
LSFHLTIQFCFSWTVAAERPQCAPHHLTTRVLFFCGEVEEKLQLSCLGVYPILYLVMKISHGVAVITEHTDVMKNVPHSALARLYFTEWRYREILRIIIFASRISLTWIFLITEECLGNRRRNRNNPTWRNGQNRESFFVKGICLYNIKRKKIEILKPCG